MTRLEFPLSGRGEGDAVHDVVMVAGEIGDQFCRLRLANLVRGPRHYDVFALALWREARAEGAESEAADVFPERRRHPSLAAVGRNLDGSNAVAAVPGNAADGDRGARLHRCATRMTGDQRIHHHLGDWRANCAVLRGETLHQRERAERDAVSRIHPEPSERLRHSVDRRDVLHPVSASPTRNNDAGREAVEVRQRLAVHLVSDDRRLLYCLPYRDAFDEVRRLVDYWAVGAIEHNLDRFLLDADLVQDIPQPSALPAGATHRAISPLHAYDVRFIQAAPIAGALIDGSYFKSRHLLHVVESELGLRIRTLAADGHLPGLDIDLRNIRDVISHKKGVVRRDGAAEIFDWRLIIRRSIGQFDERLLARQEVKNCLCPRALRQFCRKVEARR